MTQNVLTISPDEFQKALPKLRFGSLKSLLRGIYSVKWEMRDKIPYQQQLDLERKETRIWAEMQRRGFLKPKDYTDFYKWLYRDQYKRKYIPINGLKKIKGE